MKPSTGEESRVPAVAGPVAFGVVTASPGEKSMGSFTVSEGDKSVSLGIGVINGTAPGPHFVALSGIHGQELNGIAAIQAFFEEVDPGQLRGTMFLLPCANPRAAMMRSYVWPEHRHHELLRRHGDGPYAGTVTDEDRERLNMQRLWPGRTGGLLAERVTHEIWTRAIHAPHRRADLVLDMHCYKAETPGAMAVPDGEMLPLAAAAGLPNIVNMRDKPDTDLCTAVCRRAGLNALILENRGQDCVTPDALAEGVLVLRNLARHLRMLPGEPQLPEQTLVLDPWLDDRLDANHASSSIAFVCAERAGLFVPLRHPFDIVKKGDLLGRMLDVYTGTCTQIVRAPADGSIWGGASIGVCEAGRRLVGVARHELIRPSEWAARHPFPPPAAGQENPAKPGREEN